MNRVIETKTNAQVLPHVADPKATITHWIAHCSFDADLRTKHPEYRQIAERLEITNE